MVCRERNILRDYFDEFGKMDILMLMLFRE